MLLERNMDKYESFPPKLKDGKISFASVEGHFVFIKRDFKFAKSRIGLHICAVTKNC